MSREFALKQAEEQIAILRSALLESETENAALKREIETCLDIMFDYDGYRKAESLMRLIDEIRKRLADAVLKESE